MSRLRVGFVLLVLVPAATFVGLGTYTAYRSWSSLDPELDRFTAVRAAEYTRWYRERLADELRMPPERLARNAARLNVQRFTTYDGEGRVVATFPDATPLPLSPGAAGTDAMLAAARRGHTVVDLMVADGGPAWLAYLPRDGSVTVALLEVDDYPAERFRSATGYDLALYLGTTRALAARDDWPEAIPQSLPDSLASLDRALNTELDDRSAAAAPLKDFDEWDVTGAVVVRRASIDFELPRSPVLAMAGLLVATLLSILVLYRFTVAGTGPGEPRRLRQGFILVLVLPALAAAWLAAANARVLATGTDTTLAVGGAVLEEAGDRESLTTDELAGLAGAQIVWLADHTLKAASAELPVQPLLSLESSAGRVRIVGRRLAYRNLGGAIDEDLFLLSDPLEDARKATLFWLAGLYALLAVGVLIYASLVAAARSGMALRETMTAWTFIAPSLIFLLVFSAAPLLFAFYLSFHGWNLLEPAKPFVGLRHYIELAGDGLFWNAVKNTAIYSLYVPATMACALGVAILLNRSIKGVALLRAVFFLPYITSFVAISIVWQWMYDPDFGLFNWILGLIGLGPYPWLNSPSTALLALIILAVWIHIGFQMVIFLAGLQAIPNEFYEAAMIDGAGPWRRFWKITLPLLKPTTFFVLVTSIIGSFQVFTFVYVMTEGGPLYATDVIVYHIYQNAWQFLRMGYASAMSWVLFAVIFAITLLQFRMLGRRMTPVDG
jgi:ABC-type sugar transport system permease subunit